jgi:hypothetical protein
MVCGASLTCRNGRRIGIRKKKGRAFKLILFTCIDWHVISISVFKFLVPRKKNLPCMLELDGHLSEQDHHFFFGLYEHFHKVGIKIWFHKWYKK